MTYDAWKTRSPDDEYPQDDDEVCGIHGPLDMYRKNGQWRCAACDAEIAEEESRPEEEQP
jgi:hypothetical protein